MNYKNLLTIGLGIVSLHTAIAQNATVELKYVAPRKGDDVELQIKVPENPSNLSDIDKNYGYDLSTKIATLKIEQDIVNVVGKVTIAPISIKVNNTGYTTPEFTFTMDEPLPEDRNNIWIRVVDGDGFKNIIVEQYLPYEPVRNNNSVTYNYENVEFADLSSVATDDYKLVFDGSYMTGRSFENGKDVAYKRSAYKLTFNSKEPFVINERAFTNFPRGVKLRKIVVQP